MTTQWLSFASDAGFLGVVLVDEDSFEAAHIKATLAGVNPGGEVAGFSFESEDPRMSADEREQIASLPRMQLLSKADLLRAGLKGMTLGEAEATGRYNMEQATAHLNHICEDCNKP